jgi:hypothetical protein
MAQRRPYLDPELTLVNLAEALGTNRNALSLVINACCLQASQIASQVPEPQQALSYLSGYSGLSKRA